MSNEMKALVKAKAEPGLWMERRPVPEIGSDDVLIRIRKTGHKVKNAFPVPGGNFFQGEGIGFQIPNFMTIELLLLKTAVEETGCIRVFGIVVDFSRGTTGDCQGLIAFSAI